MCNLKLLIVLIFLFGFAVSCEQKAKKQEENRFTKVVLAEHQDEPMQDEGRKPEDNRFTKVVLAEHLDEPMQLEILKDGRVLFVERRGKVKVFDPATKQVSVIADIPVSIGYYSKTGEVLEPTGEDGMQGVVLDPEFEQNNWIYLYYSPKGGEPRSILARYEWQGSTLNIDSRKILLEVPNQRESCCHLGGGMLFDSEGNLLLTTGDNTPNDTRGYSPLDERPGNSRHDAQRTSGNTNDLRGKILRIHPEPNGTYSIPEGNLFPEGTPNTRPEIYTMGNRNPWRLSIDSKTGWLYWGEVGPHGITDSIGRGPRSYDEFNQARNAGNYGWPYFIADNKTYWDYDYATGKSGKKFNPAHPVNDSPNNTGRADLPPAQPAFIWYPQSSAVDFPLLGSGSNSAVGGPIYHRSDFKNPERPFPIYYEGNWFITDWTRGWIMVVTLDESGAFKSMEQFLPELNLTGPIDMDFGPDGDLYLLEYGRGPYQYNPEAQLVRIEYNEGNRKPIVQVSANKTAGSVPLKVHLSSAGTKDYDYDPLKYEWKITSQGKTIQNYTEANPLVSFDKPGIYQATLTVSDSEGAKNSKSVEIMAGNEPPVVGFDFNGANKSFFFPGHTINYSVFASDKEDGSLANKEISPSQVAVRIDYISENYKVTEITQHLQSVDASVSLQSILANQLIDKSDCKSCHSVNVKSIGPAYAAIAKKYKGDAGAQDYLVKKIISGGSGVWGDMAMPAHPTISENDANTIVKYILNLDEQNAVKSLPVNGNYTTEVPESENNTGSFIFRASYTDSGNEKAPVQSSVDIVILRNPVIPVSHADKFKDIELNHQIDPNKSSITPKGSGSYLGLNNIDLTGIKMIEFAASAIPGASDTSVGVIEIRLDSPAGKLIGQIPNILPAGDEKNNSQIKTDIDSVRGLHDVYFIFVNKKAGNRISDMQIRSIKFIQ